MQNYLSRRAVDTVTQRFDKCLHNSNPKNMDWKIYERTLLRPLLNCLSSSSCIFTLFPSFLCGLLLSYVCFFVAHFVSRSLILFLILCNLNSIMSPPFHFSTLSLFCFARLAYIPSLSPQLILPTPFCPPNPLHFFNSYKKYHVLPLDSLCYHDKKFHRTHDDLQDTKQWKNKHYVLFMWWFPRQQRFSPFHFPQCKIQEDHNHQAFSLLDIMFLFVWSAK